MAKGKLFEYAVIHHPTPTKDQNDRGESPKSAILIPPITILSISAEQAATLAARAIPDSHVDRLEEVEVVVRPF